jgi:16S rRNA (guanine966-N2)-methyltransferase
MRGMRKASGLRVIAGAFKGRRLAAPPGLATRPLPDRVKQALFDWLGQRMDGLHVADCCAGSGAFAFEALSRGARRVEMIEPGQQAVPVLRANAARLGNPSALILHPLPFQAVLPRLRDIDLIFADPPFAWYADDAARITELLRLGARALAPAGRLVLRGERAVCPPELPASLVEVEHRTYGRSWVALLQRAVDTGAGHPTDSSS